MAFDESKDVIIESAIGCAPPGCTTRILAQVCSYNGGKLKLQLKRENWSKGDWTFAKLGRMTAEEFRETVPTALELLEKHGL